MKTFASKIFPKITVYSQSEFDIYCYEHNLDDDNVENDKSHAYISIIGTKECLKYYLEEDDTTHWFKEDHNNVLNLEFDDISQDEIEWEGHTFKGFSEEQAKKSVDFIDRIVEESKILGEDCRRNFVIHCRAGMSRSQAFGAFLRDFYPDYFTAEYSNLLPHPNKDVYRKLSRYFYKKHKIYEG